MVLQLSRAQWKKNWYLRIGKGAKGIKTWRNKLTGEVRLDMGGSPGSTILGFEPKRATPYSFNPVRKDRAKRDKHYFEFEIKRKKYRREK